MIKTGMVVMVDTSCPFGRRFALELEALGINPKTTQFKVVEVIGLHGNQIGYDALASCFKGVVIAGPDGYEAMRLQRDLRAVA